MAAVMNATVITRHGGMEVFAYTERPLPTIRSQDVLVRVKACALNHLDIWTRQGMPGMTIPMPHILGCDVAGVVERIGASVKGLKIGTRVVIAPGQSCGKCAWCKQHRDSLCPQFRILGFQIDGGYAEYVAVPASHVIPVNSRWSFEEWAAVPLVFLTAWHMLMTRAGLKRGETVLVQAAGSGVGSAAIQIARWAGARVITTAGSGAKLQRAKMLGAHETVNYTTDDVGERVKVFTKGAGVDVAFEHVGPQTWPASVKSLGKGGRLVTCGATTGPKVELDLRFVFTRELSITGCYMGSRKELNQVLKLLAAGKLRPVVDSVFPLRDAAKAHEKMLSRDHCGKIVLTPEGT